MPGFGQVRRREETGWFTTISGVFEPRIPSPDANRDGALDAGVDIDLDRQAADGVEPAPGADATPTDDATAPNREHWLAPLIGPEALGLLGLVLALVGLFGERFVQLAAIALNGGLTDGAERNAIPPIGDLGAALGLVSAALGVVSLRRRPRHRTVSAWARGIAAAASMLGLLVGVGYWLLMQ